MSGQVEVSSKPSGSSPVRLDEVTLEQFEDWRIWDYHIYSANSGERNLTERVGHNVKDETLHKKNGRTLIICPSQKLETRPQERWDGIISAKVDTRWLFIKNFKKTPLRFDGHATNPWRNDDIIFHIPYFEHISDDENHICKNSAEYVAGQSWCFRDDNWTRPTLRSSGQKTTPQDDYQDHHFWNAFGGDDRKHRRTTLSSQTSSDSKKRPSVKLCFEKRCLTICMLPELPEDQEGKKPGVYPRSKCQAWTALFIAPTSIIYNEGGRIDPALLDGDLNNRRADDQSFRQQKTWKNIPADWNADYFQMCLVEVGFRKIAKQWQRNMRAIDDACRDFNNRVHAKIHSNTGRSAYWRGGVDKDLLNAYKLQTRLETLQSNLFNIIDRKEGVWHNFRNARPRKTQGELDAKKGRTQEEEAQYQRLKFLLFFCADRQADRLYGFRERIKGKIEELRTLRELLVELSQTRASLYANDLGDNVMYLTYFSILFLPLGFCTSLWSMNHELPYTAFVPTICVTSILTVLLLVYLIITFRMKDQ